MHVSSGKKGGKRNSNFELNLVPFIDILSVCILFLLVTAVFLNLGSIHVNQAVGSAAIEDKQKPKGSVTVTLGDTGDVRIDSKDISAKRGAPVNVMIRNASGKIDFKRVDQWIKSFSTNYTDVKTVMIMPNPSSKYDDLITLMASFKKSSMDQIGIAPL